MKTRKWTFGGYKIRFQSELEDITKFEAKLATEVFNSGTANLWKYSPVSEYDMERVSKIRVLSIEKTEEPKKVLPFFF